MIDKVDIWHPEVFIGNSVVTQNLFDFQKDSDTLSYIWYYYPKHMIRYAVILTTTISCNLNFQTFPFDSHECNLQLKNWIGASYRLVLNSPKIFKSNENGQEIGGTEVEMNNLDRLDYNFHFKALNSTVFVNAATEYSMAQIRIDFERTKRSRQNIFVIYHTQTAVFASLSLLSYFIPTDSVPGRMGMLIMLYLIQINTYNSVEAPPNRGFSSIEIWFIGIQSPILVAILEYGIILAIMKFQPGKKMYFKNVDFGVFILSTTYLVLFNGFYWLA